MKESIRKILKNANSRTAHARVVLTDSKPKKSVHRKAAIELTPHWEAATALINDGTLVTGKCLEMRFNTQDRSKYRINKPRTVLNFIKKYIAEAAPLQYEIAFRDKSGITGEWIFALSRTTKAARRSV